MLRGLFFGALLDLRAHMHSTHTLNACGCINVGIDCLDDNPNPRLNLKDFIVELLTICSRIKVLLTKRTDDKNYHFHINKKVGIQLMRTRSTVLSFLSWHSH